MRLLLLLTTLLAGAGAAFPASPADIATLEEHIDQLIAAEIADGAPSAAMVAVVKGDQAIVKAYGVAEIDSGRLADDQTLFRIGSISKTFLWLAVLKLVDEGKIDLDRDVNAYLTDDLQIPPYGTKPVTMRDLMAHRSGFEDTMVHFFRQDRSGTRSQWLAETMPARPFVWNQQSSLGIDELRVAGYPLLSARVAVALATVTMVTSLGHAVATVVDAREGRLQGLRLGGRVLYVAVTLAMVALLIEWNVIGATFARGLG